MHSTGLGALDYTQKKEILESGTFKSCVNSLASTRHSKKALPHDIKVRKCDFRKEILSGKDYSAKRKNNPPTSVTDSVLRKVILLDTD